jgi:hypothetical protein
VTVLAEFSMAETALVFFFPPFFGGLPGVNNRVFFFFFQRVFFSFFLFSFFALFRRVARG